MVEKVSNLCKLNLIGGGLLSDTEDKEHKIFKSIGNVGKIN